MNKNLLDLLPVPPALVYLLHQLKQHDIEYAMFGEVEQANMVFVDIDRNIAQQLRNDHMPSEWSLITPHFLSQRALAQGKTDPIADGDHMAEAVVIAFGEREAEGFENFKALCEQVRYLKQHCPSRLVYHSNKPPEPLEIHALIDLLKSCER